MVWCGALGYQVWPNGWLYTLGILTALLSIGRERLNYDVQLNEGGDLNGCWGWARIRYVRPLHLEGLLLECKSSSMYLRRWLWGRRDLWSSDPSTMLGGWSNPLYQLIWSIYFDSYFHILYTCKWEVPTLLAYLLSRDLTHGIGGLFRSSHIIENEAERVPLILGKFQ